MSVRIPCRICGVEVLQSTYDVTGGLCGRCARGHKLCEHCGTHYTYFASHPDGCIICDRCRAKPDQERRRVKHLDLDRPTMTDWEIESPSRIRHPVLGLLERNPWEWVTAPLLIGSFGYTAPITVETAGETPFQRQFDLMVAVVQSSAAFRDEVATYLAHEYEIVRPDYLKTIGNPEYTRQLTMSALPELNHPNEVWQLLPSMGVFIDENLGLCLSFGLAFDCGHEINVRIREGIFYEVLLEG